MDMATRRYYASTSSTLLRFYEIDAAMFSSRSTLCFLRDRRYVFFEIDAVIFHRDFTYRHRVRRSFFNVEFVGSISLCEISHLHQRRRSISFMDVEIAVGLWVCAPLRCAACSDVQYATISMIIPTIKGIRLQLSNLVPVVKDARVDKFLQRVHYFIDAKLGHYERNQLCQMATLMDPRFKKKGFWRTNGEEEAKALVQNLLVEEMKKFRAAAACQHEVMVKLWNIDLENCKINDYVLQFLQRTSQPELPVFSSKHIFVFFVMQSCEGS
ncbi:hypothetical protein U1Q18_046284 [Sarracenia purpurea var. burkii]